MVRVLNIEIPSEYVPGLLKGRGQIEPRRPFAPFVISQFSKDSPAKSAGMVPGDEIVSLDGNKFTYYDEFQKYLAGKKSSQIVLNIIRDGKKMDLTVTPTSTGLLGVYDTRKFDDIFDLQTIKIRILSIGSCRHLKGI